ncbi:MAG: chromophore lyase [Prevotella sp.]|nr:chromophore lyase [Prevotella sp.]
MPAGSSTQFTVTYSHSDKVIKSIAFKWNKVPASGTVSANYGSFSSYPGVWTAPSGGIKSVRFSSNGASEGRVKQIIVYLQDAASSSSSSNLSAYDLNKPVGWATVDGSVTGSNNQNAVTVTNITDFLSAMEGTTARTVYVKGTITVTGQVSVKDCSNKTVYGLPGSSFSNLTHSSDVSKSGILNMSRCSNIILRNLTFKGAGAYDIDGKDNLTMQTCDYIWVDHCDFQDGVDGNFDANNGSDHLAITWCRFRYLIAPWPGGSGGSDDHRNTNLWGGSDSNTKDVGKLRTTFANCWWDEGCHERNPRVRNGKVHIVNCYYSYEDNNYCIGAGYKSNIYADGNHFDNVNKPWACYATSGSYTDYNITMKNNLGASDVQQRSGSNSYFNPYSTYSYTAYSSSLVKGEVTAHAGATLQITEGGTVSSAKSNVATFESETTGIDNVTSTQSNQVLKTEVFNLSGMRVSGDEPGIKIVKTTMADGTVRTTKISQ